MFGNPLRAACLSEIPARKQGQGGKGHERGENREMLITISMDMCFRPIDQLRMAFLDSSFLVFPPIA